MNPFATIREWSARALGLESRNGYTGSGGGYVPSAPVLSGTFVTPETALGLSAVFCAINVISRDMAVLPRNVYRVTPDGGREIERTGYLGDLNDIISVQPNDDMDAMRWGQAQMGHVLGRGNGFSEIVRKRGFVRSIEIMHPRKTVPKRTTPYDPGRPGRLYYEDVDTQKKFDPENILHFAGLGFDGIQGYSPVTLMRQTVGVTMGAEQYAAAFYGNGARPGGFLKTSKKLNEAAVNNLRKTFNQVHQGSQSAHQIGILEEGMDWVDAQISPEDSQFVATREFQVKDIARMFAIPPHKIGDYSEADMANVEQSNLDYLSMTLMGWVAMFEMQLNVKLLSRDDRKTHKIILDVSALLRGDITAQMNRITTLRNTGAWSADDIRRDQGMNPLGKKIGGDKYVVQGQYVPLDQVGKMPTSMPKPGQPEKTEKKSEFPGLEDRIGHLNGEANGK